MISRRELSNVAVISSNFNDFYAFLFIITIWFFIHYNYTDKSLKHILSN